MQDSNAIDCLNQLLSRSPKSKLSDEDVDFILIEGVHTQQLRKVADRLLKLPANTLSPKGITKIEAAKSACQSISQFAKNEANAVRISLVTQSIASTVLSEKIDEGSLQHHSVTLQIDPEDIEDAIQRIKSIGYQNSQPLRGAAWKSFKANRSKAVFIRTDSATTRLILNWGDPNTETSSTRRFKPNDADYRAIQLPDFLWRQYPIVRLFRGFTNKIRSKKDPQPEWPFLGTPLELINPLFETLDIDGNDVVVDIGCGDGRIVVEAAKKFGCRAIGIEKDESLTDLARKKIADNSVQERASVIHSDNLDHDLKDATVVFLFLPIRCIPDLILELRNKLKKGARIIAHEQERPAFTLSPDYSVPLFSESAITVAHVWTV